MDSTWTTVYETILRTKGEEAIASKWLHRKSAFYYKVADSSLSGLMAVISFSISFLEKENLIEGYITYLSFSVGMLALIQQLTNLSGKNSTHKSTALEYEDIVNIVSSELAKPRDKREKIEGFMKEINNKMISCNKNAPHVYQCITNKFYKKFGHLKMASPVSIDHINAIVVNSGNERENLIQSPIDINNNSTDTTDTIQDKWQHSQLKSPLCSISTTKKLNLLSSEFESHIAHKQIHIDPTLSLNYEVNRLNAEFSAQNTPTNLRIDINAESIPVPNQTV
jgi:hypothetical protein